LYCHAAIKAFTNAALWASADTHNISATTINMAMTLHLEHAATEVQHWAVHHTAGEQLSSADVAVFGAAECWEGGTNTPGTCFFNIVPSH